ncbi:SpoIIE family protein phosphatase/ATP-binding protein [Nocardiopsis sp. FIRDI 009]|uniref:SpoIIE family protein phosphatase/ATP-binding protein n=1 Tax=Nocardiopsis sp. FIRDI 009 TaxID=714197 RepID=UPI000E239779|nr:SpoIIE family protein phosphatase/ATP-binding protein [Nocardiopsis sp. FIRDI 009]
MPRFSPRVLWVRSDGRPRFRAGAPSVAGQMFVLQLLVVVVLVALGAVALVLQSRYDSERGASARSLAVAETFARAPGMVEALESPDPSAVLQPLAERARERSRVDFIVVMTPEGTRYTHPNPERIGETFIGTIGPAAAGGIVTETYTGTLGPSVRAVVPVTAEDGEVVGLVSAGVTLERIGATAAKQLPLLIGGAAAVLVLATVGSALIGRRLRHQTHGLGPTEMTRMYEHHDAVLHSVKEGVLITDGDGRLVLSNDEADRLLGLPPDAAGRHVDDLGLPESVSALLVSGRVATDEVHPAGDLLLAVNQRTTDLRGGPPGSVMTLRDATELRVLSERAELARKRLKLLYDAGGGIGTTLDVRRTAEELAQVAVPRFADFIAVDLPDPVLRGEEPGPTSTVVRRVALRGVRDDPPLYPVGELIEFVPSTPQAKGLGGGEAVLLPDLTDAPAWQAQDPERAERIVGYGIHSLISVPLRARGSLLGTVTFLRSRRPAPFDEDDLSLSVELAARAAICIDNARRYTREHTMAVTLQRSLLPRGLPEQSAFDVAHRYLPAQAGEAGGDWFDVIPLSGARVALVVGDVVGHGMHAAATMGRLRTAVHNFSTLDLPPDELLARIDELVTRIDLEESESAALDGVPDQAVTDGLVGATCLYAVYDPISGRCVLARAGHPLPALVGPDGDVTFPELPAGPPLGLGGLPFESQELLLPEGGQLVLYTDGLLENRDRDIGSGLTRLRRTLAATAGRAPDEACREVFGSLLTDRPQDDVALLIARARRLPQDRVADWDVPTDPAAVAPLRASVTRQLTAWELDESVFVTELILSELVTNAIRYGRGPIRVRLIYDRSLICEVSDAASTAPHLRYAASTDEGGRGLFLVAQLAERWGTRYTAEGKVIWAEQSPDGRQSEGAWLDVV